MAKAKAKSKKEKAKEKAAEKKAKEEELKKQEEKRAARSRLYEEVVAIIVIALGIFLIFALFTSMTGQFGAAISWFFKGCFGMLAFALPFYLILYGILLFAKKAALRGVRSAIFLTLIFLMFAIINSGRFIDADTTFAPLEFFDTGELLTSGGIIGMTIGYGLVQVIGKVGLYIFCIVVTIISVLFIINTPISNYFERLSRKWNDRKEKKEALRTEEDQTEEPKKTEPENENKKPTFLNGISTEKKRSESQVRIIDYMNDDTLFDEPDCDSDSGGEPVDDMPQSTDTVEPQLTNKEAGEAILSDSELNTKKVSKRYKLPSVDLLKKSAANVNVMGESQLTERAAKLEQTLADFKIRAKVSQVTMGPAVTRYEIQPDTGVKVNSIVRLADDIALNLEAKSIRIEAPIPGKAAVGIEVENERVNLVTLRDIIDSRDFRSSKSKISFAVGKDISGNNIVGDLKSMPHLLIAGATGSGKSVCINSIIMSILYKAKPDEVKLVLIDPKVVELRNYDGIPHLLIPVVTEPGKAAASLNWAVAEMNDRYKKFASSGVKDLASYNDFLTIEGRKEEILPQIVIIIDELADLMMISPSKVEEAICRIAQMARAAGMHLIVATQRPSVDVVTGVIKANIPSRIAFAVSSQFDSRTILDMNGAEHLVGKGDMLYSPVGVSKPFRVQGTFVTDEEVHTVIDFVKSQGPEVEYSDEIIERIENEQPNAGKSRNDGDDELLDEAIETVVLAKQASTSMLQRRFRIGYNRAARLMDMLEERGIIGPPDGSRPRNVLMSEEELGEDS